jgi:hypothetical protein
MTCISTAALFVFRRFFRGGKDEHDDPLLAHHDKKVGPSGKNIETLDSIPVPAAESS